MLMKAEEAVGLVWYDCLQNVIEMSALNLLNGPNVSN